MSTAAATADAPAPKKGKKKLLIILAAVLALVLAGGGGAAWFLMKKKAAAEAETEAQADGEAAPAKSAKRDPKAVPTFVPLDPFTVNLADRDAERYAQVGITLEIADPKGGEQIKAFMPVIRNHILMAIADRQAGELMDREGKAKLAEQIRLDTSRALGHELPAAGAAKKSGDDELPIVAVHFSNFIIQ